MIRSEREIKPCPFCGHAHAYVQPPLAFFDMALVSCAKCGAIGPMRALQTVEEALVGWNTRTGTAPMGAQHAEPVASPAAEDVTFFLPI